MTVTTRIVTLAAAAVQFPAAAFGGLVSRVYVVPLRANTHISYVGISTVTNDASGVGVVRELAQPPAATVSTDSFDVADNGGLNTIDPTQYWGHGTTGEKLLVSYYQQ